MTIREVDDFRHIRNAAEQLDAVNPARVCKD